MTSRGRPSDPAYYRKWRATHPEYRKRQTRLKAEARRKRGRESRVVEYRNRTAKRAAARPPPLPALHQGHSLLDKAVALVTKLLRPDRRSTLYDPTFDELVGETVLALIVGDDPLAHATAYLRSERLHRKMNMPLDETRL